jgi:hypothetical protein
MIYHRCSTEELANICKSRGLTIKLEASLSPKRERRRACFAALKHGDKNAGAFRFLDLSPELRTVIYEHLLVLDQSCTCHPQILAASKQVHSEAKNILYGNNLIEIKMWNDGVYVHGQLCGTYVRGIPIEVAWPDFLRRAQFLRFSHGATGMGLELLTPAILTQARSELWGSFVSDNILYSLCTFLMEGHQLRSMKVDLRRVEHHDFDDTFDTYALHLLGPLKRCVVEGHKGVSKWMRLKELPSLPDVTAAMYASWFKSCTSHEVWHSMRYHFSNPKKLPTDLPLFAQEVRRIRERSGVVHKPDDPLDDFLHLEIQSKLILRAEKVSPKVVPDVSGRGSPT